MTDAQSLRIVLIGAGNLATNLGLALTASGYNVVQVYSRTAASAGALAERLDCDFTDGIDKIRDDADLYFVAIKDSALEVLSEVLTGINPNALWVHTAGSMPIDVFACCRRGVFYPMQTFSKRETVDFRSIPVFLETAVADDMDILRSIADDLSDKVYELGSDDRKLLHLSAVFCCNFVNHCCTMAADILSDKNIPFDVMLPLIDRTVEKLHTFTPLEAQTGPAVRYDENVIGMQMSLLNHRPDLQHIYELMSKSIHKYKIKGKKEE